MDPILSQDHLGLSGGEPSTITTHHPPPPPLPTPLLPKMEDQQQQLTLSISHKNQKNKQYKMSTKLQIINRAQVIGNRAAAREYNVDEKSIRDWRKQKTEIMKAPSKRIRLPGAGRKGPKSPSTAAAAAAAAAAENQPKHKQYKMSTKLQIINRAQVIGNRATAREFNVDEKSIRDWRKQKSAIIQAPSKRIRLPGAGKKVLSAELDQQLALYVKNLHDRNLHVTYKMIECEAKRLYNALVYNQQVTVPIDFKVSRGYIYRFCQRQCVRLSQKSRKKKKGEGGDDDDDEKEKEKEEVVSPKLELNTENVVFVSYNNNNNNTFG